MNIVREGKMHATYRRSELFQTLVETKLIKYLCSIRPDTNKGNLPGEHFRRFSINYMVDIGLTTNGPCQPSDRSPNNDDFELMCLHAILCLRHRKIRMLLMAASNNACWRWRISEISLTRTVKWSPGAISSYKSQHGVLRVRGPPFIGTAMQFLI